MVKFKVPLKDILGRAYYQYELSSSNYNPHIDDTITITCICKNILGNPIPNKELTLMMNGIEQGTSTTNELGIATWSITFRAWGNKHFYIGNATLDLVVTGWRTAVQDSNYLVKYTDKLVSVTLHTTTTSTINTTYQEYEAEVLKDTNRNIDLRPRMPIGTINASANCFVCKDNSYKIGRFRLSGSTNARGYAHFLYERR